MSEIDELRAKLAASEASRERLLEACRSAMGFINNLCVPQTAEDAALQVWIGSTVMRQLEAAIAAEQEQKGE